MLINILSVGIGGFMGSVARYLVYLLARAYAPLSFPIATLLVNVIGCLLIGALSTIIERHQPTSTSFILFASVGIIGGFTTFSAFGLETVALFRANQSGFALLNVTANLILGFGSVWLGHKIIEIFS